MMMSKGKVAKKSTKNQPLRYVIATRFGSVTSCPSSMYAVRNPTMMSMVNRIICHRRDRSQGHGGTGR